MSYLDPKTFDEVERRAGGRVISSLGDNYVAAREEAWRNNMFNSDRLGEIEITQEQKERASRMESILGFELPATPEGDTPGDAARRGQRRRVPQTLADEMLGREATIINQTGGVERARALYDEKIHALNAVLPKGEKPFLTLAEIRKESLRRAASARARAGEVGSRAGTAGDIGGFLGHAATALRDPVNIFASVASAPAYARGFLAVVLAESFANASAEAFIQTSVVPWLIEQGVDRKKAMEMGRENVLFAAALGGLLGGAIFGGAKGLGKLGGKLKKSLNKDNDLEALEHIADKLEEAHARGEAGENALATAESIRAAVEVERTAPGGRKAPEDLARHAENIDEADEAIRANRMPDPEPVPEAAETNIGSAKPAGDSPEIMGGLAVREKPDGTFALVDSSGGEVLSGFTVHPTRERAMEALKKRFGRAFSEDDAAALFPKKETVPQERVSEAPRETPRVEGETPQGEAPPVRKNPRDIPPHDEKFVKGAEARAADVEGQARDLEQRFAEIDMVELQARVDAKDPGAIALKEGIEDIKASDDALAAMIACLGEV